MMYFFSEWHRHTRKKIRALRSRVEPKTFRLLVRMLYHRATGDSWELRSLNWLGSWDKYPAYILLGLQCQLATLKLSRGLGRLANLIQFIN